MLSNQYLINQPGGNLSPETKSMLMKMKPVKVNNDILSTRDHLDFTYHWQPQNSLSISEFNFNNIRIRSYYQQNLANQTSPALIYMHGGGFVGGTLNALDATCRIIADNSNFRVFSLDYHLAPESPFPSALMDGYNFLLELARNARQYSIDPQNIFMAGDSAGGNPTIGTALLDSNAFFGTNYLKRVVAFYPPVSCATHGNKKEWNVDLFKFDSTETHELVQNYVNGFLNHSANYDPWYVGNGDPHNPLISPYYASDEQLAQLPPIKIIIGEFDGLRVLAQPFAERILKLNSQSRFEIYNGLVHAFLRPQTFPEAQAAIKDALNFLKGEK